MQKRWVLCVLLILTVILQPALAESATGNISGRIVSSDSETSQSSSFPPSSTSSSGGGGGGGGPPLFNSTFSNAFVTSKYIYEEGEVPLQLTATYTNATDVVNVSIVVDNPLYIDFRFANVIRLPDIEMPENAYRVYEFVFTKFGTRTKVQPKNAIVTFRISSSWVERAEDVRLFEYLNNSWVEHPTELLGTDGNFVYFKSSFNRSGFYYLGYPESEMEVKSEATKGTEWQGVNESRESEGPTVPLTSTNTSLSSGTSSPNVVSTQTPSQNWQGALQESLIGDVLNDIVDFLSSVFEMIRSFFGF